MISITYDFILSLTQSNITNTQFNIKWFSIISVSFNGAATMADNIVAEQK